MLVSGSEIRKKLLFYLYTFILELIVLEGCLLPIRFHFLVFHLHTNFVWLFISPLFSLIDCTRILRALAVIYFTHAGFVYNLKYFELIARIFAT